MDAYYPPQLGFHSATLLYPLPRAMTSGQMLVLFIGMWQRNVSLKRAFQLDRQWPDKDHSPDS